ncbi:MAG TPA: UDP-N-acetylmuramoyl-L-alanine--D-glutamate ligase, partial [Thermoleophilaceae bacterium]
VAVTGTNGKTTTAELLGAMHRAAGVPVAVAGNVGTPLSSLVGELDPAAVVVCECSSFQLEDATAFAPDVGLLLNMTEDHLDRHGSVEAYRAAKLRLFAHQREGQTAIAPAALELPGAATRVTFGGADSDLALHGGAGVDPARGPAVAAAAAVDTATDAELRWRGEPLIAADEIRLRGAHNLENAMGAAAAALSSGLPADAVAQALRGFAGVPHRLEEVGTVGGVLYVNDSKATNVDAARRGIEAFAGGVHVILGGSLKGGGFSGLREAVAARCEAAYLIGAAADRLEADLAGTVALRRCGNLQTAMRAAAAAARPGEVVLLSPACASYDQYRDYEQRGEHFRSLLPAA